LTLTLTWSWSSTATATVAPNCGPAAPAPRNVDHPIALPRFVAVAVAVKDHDNVNVYA
jgi:hypothetical protein